MSEKTRERNRDKGKENRNDDDRLNRIKPPAASKQVLFPCKTERHQVQTDRDARCSFSSLERTSFYHSIVMFSSHYAVLILESCRCQIGIVHSGPSCCCRALSTVAGKCNIFIIEIYFFIITFPSLQYRNIPSQQAPTSWPSLLHCLYVYIPIGWFPSG